METSFAQSGVGVTFYEPVDIYQRNYRAVHYAVLLIVITFLTFFLWEHMAGIAIHGMQYLMVGLALALFYLLLLALSEHMSFDLAYGLSAGALVTLITIYLTGVLRRVDLALGAGAGLATLYTMLYWILRSEDYSLLMGSLLLFGVLAILMIATRRVDWSNVARLKRAEEANAVVNRQQSGAAERDDGPSNGGVALGAHRIQTCACRAQHRLARQLGPTGIEGRRRSVFDRQLNGFGEIATADFRHHLECHVDSRGDAAAREDDAVAHHAAGVLRDAEVGELVAPRPMTGGALATQQSGCREQQRSRADRGDVAGLVRRAGEWRRDRPDPRRQPRCRSLRAHRGGRIRRRCRGDEGRRSA